MQKIVDLKTKLYQMFVLGTEGGEYIKALKSGLGGIIFFTHDIKSKEQFISLVRDIKSQALISPFLSVDQEGGRVERTENIHNGKKYLSAKYAFEKGLDFLKNQTKEIAVELKSYGLNLNFAPCIDVNTNPNNPIIGERAFSINTQDVITAEKIVSKTYEANGIIPCVKHFPGHGDANTDSHLTLPEINMNFETLEKFNSIDNDVKDIIGGLVLQAINQNIKANDAELSRNLIKTKQEILQSVLNSANDMEDKYNKLVLEKEKANIKYENLIEAIERGITIEK